MNISYSDGSHFIGPYDDRKLVEEMAKPAFVKAQVYVPGAEVVMSDRTYRVGPHGNLIRIR